MPTDASLVLTIKPHGKSTRLAAETLQIITGLDVGYNDQFLDNYTDADEPERLRMLAKWRDWYNKEVGTVAI